MNGSELKSLYDRCIRLTAENKLTKSNVWDMDIIFHMPNIIREHSAGENFSFQRASCGLDAGVGIYSKRVDSVYDTARDALFGFKGVNTMENIDEDDEGEARADGVERGDDVGSSQDQDSNSNAVKPKSKKPISAFVDPSSTLADPESLRAKEQDVTFDLDPLFTKMTKLFDEAGLLLLNLGSYGNCEIMFDSSQVPSSGFPLAPLPPSSDLAPVNEKEEAAGLALARQCLPGLQALSVPLHQQRGSNPTLRITPTFDKMLQLQGGRNGGGGAGWWSRVVEQGGGRNGGGGAGSWPDAEAIVGAALSDDASFFKRPSTTSTTEAPPPPAISKVKALTAAFEARMRGEEVASQSPIVMQTSAQVAAAAAAALSNDLASQTAIHQPAFDVDDDGFVIGAPDDGDDGGFAGGGGDSFSDEDEEERGGAEKESELSAWLAKQEKNHEGGHQPRGKMLQLRGGASGTAFWRFSGSSSSAAAAQKKATANPEGGATKKTKKAASSSSKLRLDSDDEDPDLEERMKMRGRPEETQLSRRPKAKTLMRQAQGSSFESKSLLNLLPAHPLGSQISVLSIWRAHAQQAARSLGGERRNMAPYGDRDEWDDGGDDGGGHDGGGWEGEDGEGGDGYGGGGGGGGEGGASVGNKRKSLGQWAAAAEAAAWEAGMGGMAVGEEESDLLLKYGGHPAPKVTEKIEVSFDRVAKVVDVKALKEKLHGSIKEQLGSGSEQGSRGGSNVPFQEIITSLQPQIGAPVTKELSVHLCFICLLHLANENSLALTNNGALDRLDVSYKI